MRTLAVLLGASILLNIVLIARRPTETPAEPRPVPKPRPAAAAPATPDPEVEALRTRVRELETRRTEAVVASPAPARTTFREKVARAMKLWRDSRALQFATPEQLMETQEVTLEFQRARLLRFKDPKGYVEVLRSVLEQAAIETKKPLNDAQREALNRALEEVEVSLGGLESADAWERYLREVGPEADALQRLRTFVTPEQEARVMAFGALSPWSASTAPWIDRRQAEGQVVQTWMAAYGLDEAQRSAVSAAARVYLNAADAVNAQMGAAAVPGRETPEWRRRTAQILLDALSSLEGSLTPEQRERLRGRRPAEVRVYDALQQQRWAR